MGIFDGIKGQFRSVIQWENPELNALFFRWSDRGDEIKNASKLLVGPGQGCIFVYEGKVEAVFDEEGMKELKTANIPFWTTITKFMQAFESEHKVGLYFYRKTQFLDQKWGTPSVIKYYDPVYKFPVGLKARGNYSFRITDAKSFFVSVVGGKDLFLTDDIRPVITSRLSQPMMDFFAESKLSYADIDSKREEISSGLLVKLKPEFDKFGFEMLDFRIEVTEFDEDTNKRVGRIADMQAESMAANAAGVNFAQLQQLDAMKMAASNPGSAGMAMGMGVGMGFGQGMGNAAFGTAQNAPAAEDPMVKLKKIKEMLDAGLITQEDYENKKKAILEKM
jgi:membrane protease subunit (stomatin/prohibitin family)